MLTNTDDGILHCRTEAEAKYLRSRLAARLRDCGLEMHPEKTRIVYCKDSICKYVNIILRRLITPIIGKNSGETKGGLLLNLGYQF